MAQHWAVCRAYSSRVHIVRSEIEKANHGTFLPTYTRIWASDGKLSCRERVLMPGYLFFMTTPRGWGEVKNLYGVFDVLSNDGFASPVTDEEMYRIVIGAATGEHNKIDLSGLEREKPRYRKSRRPRPSRRARAAA